MFAGALLSIAASTLSGFYFVMWIPTGFSFTILFLLGLEYWPFIVLGESLAYFFNHVDFWFSVLGPLLALVINYAVAAHLKKRLSNLEAFVRLRDLLAFLVWAVILGPAFSSAISAFFFVMSNHLLLTDFFITWRAWWLGQGMGTLVIGSFLINTANDFQHSKPILKTRKLEASLLFLAILGTSIFIFTPLATYNKSMLVRPYFLYTLMLYSSLRFNLLGSSLTSLTMAVCASVGQALGFIAFSTVVMKDYENVVMLQLVVAAISITGSIVAATVREKSEALELKNEFLDIASHELKTPITSLKLQLELLQRRLSKKNELTQAETEQKVFLTKVDRQVNRLIKIVEQLLDVSRAERKQIDLDYEEISLLNLANSLIERLASDLQNAKCRIEVDIPYEIKGVWDPFRFEQTLENLLTNAIKYAPGSLIKLRAKLSGNDVEITVQDNGPGITVDRQHAIFERFVRVNNVRHVQGLGLGLYITKQIVEAHGGSIAVSSDRDNGTLFTMHLPLKPIAHPQTIERPLRA